MLIRFRDDPQPHAVYGLIQRRELNGIAVQCKAKAWGLSGCGGKRDAIAADFGMAQRGSFDDIVFDIEIAAIHLHPLLAEAGKDGRVLRRMGKDDAAADCKREAVAGLFE